MTATLDNVRLETDAANVEIIVDDYACTDDTRPPQARNKLSAAESGARDLIILHALMFCFPRFTVFNNAEPMTRPKSVTSMWHPLSLSTPTHQISK